MIHWWWLIPALFSGMFVVIFVGSLMIAGDETNYADGYHAGFNDALHKLDERMLR